MTGSVIKRPARPRTAPEGVVTITTPNDAECSLPPSRRVCVSTTCAAALTPRLQPGASHPTRCALDSGGLIADKREGVMQRRRGDCLRLYQCEEAWLEPDTEAAHGQACCPHGCLGFVPVGGIVPVAALSRKKAA